LTTKPKHCIIQSQYSNTDMALLEIRAQSVSAECAKGAQFAFPSQVLLQEVLPTVAVEWVKDYNKRSFEQRGKSGLAKVTVGEFQKPFESPMEKFDSNGRINRANFTPTLVTFLGIAQGGYGRPIAVFDWAEIHMQSDMMSTVANYLEAGGFKNLNENEKDFFLNAYHRANINESDHPRVTKESAGEIVDGNLLFLANPFEYKTRRVVKGSELANLSFIDLYHRVRQIEKRPDREEI